MQKFLLVAITFFFFGTLFGQSIEKTWHFSEVKDENGLSILNTNPEKDYLKLENGSFEYQLSQTDSLKVSGDYIFQNNLLVLFYNSPKDSIQRYRVKELTDSTFILSENNILYKYTTPTQTEITNVAGNSNSKSNLSLNPDRDVKINFTNILRGIIGMTFLLLVCFLLSSNRRKIDWKLVATGLALQIVFALLVLKVEFIAQFFDWISDKVVKFLNFSEKGAEFLFGGLVTDMNTFGYIFAFKVLPTIVFFSAFTSLLYYLG